MQQQIISDLNPNAAEFVSKEELWFVTMEKQFVTNNSWLFEDNQNTQLNENEYEPETEPCSTPPQMITECEVELEFVGLDQKAETFYDCE